MKKKKKISFTLRTIEFNFFCSAFYNVLHEAFELIEHFNIITEFALLVYQTEFIIEHGGCSCSVIF